MRRFLLGTIMLFFVVLSASIISNPEQVQAANVSLSTTVLYYLDFAINTGASVPFGNLQPGTPISGPSSGTITTVTTNAANGYTIVVSDGSDTNSAMAQGGTYIADYAGTITTPTTWTGTGLGVTLFAADTTKESKWGTGTAYNDANNKYAGVPAGATVAHTVTGFPITSDTASWAFKIDVPNTQKTGAYTGNVVFSALPVLS